MPSFSDLAKSIGSCISKAIAFRIRTSRADTTKTGSGFVRWLESYKNLKSQELSEKAKVSINKEKIPTICNEGFKKNLQNGTVRCYSSSRLVSDKSGAINVSIPTGMRFARLLNKNSHPHLGLPSTIYLQSKRWKCGRENCKDPCNWPLCPPGNERWLKDTEMFNIYKAYWDERKDICCEDPCVWASPRFDDIYQTESDKYKRIYQRTWWECPHRVIQKRICCLNEGLPPEYCKRPKKERPPTACELPCPIGTVECPRVTAPCCCPRAKKIKCRPLLRKALDCKRFCTPYPAFSECARNKLRVGPPKECRCLAPVGMCEFWNYWRARFANRSCV